MERSLASVQTIIKVEPIEGADKIEKVSVLGWQCVAKKGDFKTGDKCVYFEIDSLLPLSNPVFEFLKKKDGQVEHRLRTIKMRGVVSQGLAMPISILNGVADLAEGLDVTEQLGITKYEAPISYIQSGGGKIRIQTFPTHLAPKTDEMRIQSVPKVLDEIHGHPYVATIKMDGTSATYIYHDGEFMVCSRNNKLEAVDESAKRSVYMLMAEQYGLDEKLSKLGNVALQGEICGPSIQSNSAGLKEAHLYVFDIWDIDKREHWDATKVEMWCRNNGLEMVEVFTEGEAFNLTQEELLAYADAAKYPNGHQAEGLVFRANPRMYSEKLRGRLSFKVISNNYLLSNGE